MCYVFPQQTSAVAREVMKAINTVALFKPFSALRQILDIYFCFFVHFHHSFLYLLFFFILFSDSCAMPKTMIQPLSLNIVARSQWKEKPNQWMYGFWIVQRATATIYQCLKIFKLIQLVIAWYRIEYLFGRSIGFLYNTLTLTTYLFLQFASTNWNACETHEFDKVMYLNVIFLSTLFCTKCVCMRVFNGYLWICLSWHTFN